LTVYLNGLHHKIVNFCIKMVVPSNTANVNNNNNNNNN